MTIVLLACCLLALPLAACGDSAENQAEAACACEKGKAGATVWCEECAADPVGGEKTECKDCFQAKQGGPACEKCKK